MRQPRGSAVGGRVADADRARDCRRAVLGCWPDRLERRRLLRLWLRWRRQPGRDCSLPHAWRRQPRLGFWWTLLLALLRDPWLMLAALAALPAWLAWLLWRWHAG